MNFVLTTNHPRDDTASLPQYVTTWRENELRVAVMGLQWLYWRYMPGNWFREGDCGWPQPLGLLLPLLYPDSVRPAVAGEYATGEALLRLDPEMDWKACMARGSWQLPRATSHALRTGQGGRDYKRDVMLRELHRVAAGQFAQNQRLDLHLFLVRVAQALFQGEIGILHLLDSEAGDRLAYRIRDYCHGCDRLFDDRAAGALRQNIARLEEEGNSRLLQHLRQVMEQHHQVFMAAACGSPRAQRNRWQANYDALSQQVQVALLNIRRRDAVAIAALAERCYQHGQDRRPVMAAPLSPGFDFFGELLRQGLPQERCKMLWWLAVKSIAAEMQVEAWIAARFLYGSGWELARPLVNALHAGIPAPLALARLPYPQQKSHALRAELLHIGSIEDMDAHTLQDLLKPADQVIARNAMNPCFERLTPVIFTGEIA